jgi:N-acetylglucosaminylphosphatidylinositol deacetylase
MSLQIPYEQVKVLDHPKLQVLYFESILAYLYILFENHVILALYISQDGFHEKWDHGLVAELTMEHVQLWAIDTVVATSQRPYELQNTLHF